MSRFRLYPTLQQAAALAQHCAHARYVWNAVEQLGYRSRGQRMPGHAEQDQQLTEARRDTARLQRKVCPAKRGSTRRANVKARLARLHARNADTRKDFIEKVSTAIVRTYDLIRIEDLRVAGMTRSARGTVEAPGRNVRQKAGLNRSILAGGWSLFATRPEQKAPGRVKKVNPAFSSQRGSACGHIARESRKSQALFRCVACGPTSNADLNAACNIAAGHAVTARGGSPWGGPVNREPQHAPSQVV